MFDRTSSIVRKWGGSVRSSKPLSIAVVICLAVAALGSTPATAEVGPLRTTATHEGIAPVTKKKRRARSCRKRLHGKIRRVRCKRKKPPAIATPISSASPAGPVSSTTPTAVEPSLPDGAPHVLYTDLASGPNSGGEGGNGAYLTIFGKNFGSTGLGSTLRVFIGGNEVSTYRSLGASRARSDVQQLVVQVGSLSNPTPGVALPVRVEVAGVASNTDRTFTVQPGRMLFVSTAGNDASAVPGDITRPFRHVQTADLTAGAWGNAQPGDIIVMRGGTWTDTGREQYFIRFIKSNGSSGTAPSGLFGSGPIALVGYPGEDAFVNATATTHPNGAISGLNGQNYPSAGKWITIANLRIEGGGHDGPISQQIYGDDWRIVNNELSAETGVATSKMAGITGNGARARWFGNDIHDIHGSSGEAHGIYVDGDGSYEIAYNDIHDVFSGNGISLFCNGGNGSDYIDDVQIHHNEIAEVSKHLINISDGSRGGIAVWNNVAHGAQVAGLRFNTTDLVGARFFNNTFYDMNRIDSEIYGALMNDWGLPIDAVDIRNNIFAMANGTAYGAGSVGFGVSAGTITHNLYFGGSGLTNFDANPVTGNPLFVTPGGDHSLQAGSPAIDSGSAVALSLVTNDFTATTSRSQGATIDIGAFER